MLMWGSCHCGRACVVLNMRVGGGGAVCCCGERSSTEGWEAGWQSGYGLVW